MAKFKITEDYYRGLDRDLCGLCMNCGTENFAVEPDAEEYPCEQCGEDEVFGAQQLLLMGEIEFE